MKIKKSILTVALSSAMVMSTMSVPAAASNEFWGNITSADNDAPNLTVSAGFDSKITLPLTLDASSPTFNYNANLSPGDTTKSNIILENQSDVPIKISISNIENMLPEDEKAKMLLDVLELTINIEDEVYYQGKHSELSVPFMPYVTIEPHKDLVLTVSMKFPREADNRYQGAKYKMRWVFDATAEPLPETTPVVTPTPTQEPVKTGVETEEKTSPIRYILIGIPIVGVLGGGIAFGINKFKKKKK